MLESPELVDWIPPGLQDSEKQVISSNEKYYAYATFLSVYVLDQKTKKIVYHYSKDDRVISSISLNPCFHGTIVISFIDRISHVYNFEKDIIEFSFETPEVVYYNCWAASGEILVFTQRVSGKLFYRSFRDPIQCLNIDGKSILFVKSVYLGEFIFICGCSDGKIIRFSLIKSKIESCTENSSVCSIDCDPNNPSNCLCVWKCGIIRVMDLKQGLSPLNIIDTNGHEIGSACWMKKHTGHFVTGDSNNGIIRIWNPANSSSLESIFVYDFGIVHMVLLKDDFLLCSFTNQFIGIYDIFRRVFVWKLFAGHNNTIFCFNFLSDHSKLVSCGAEGVVCLWNIRKKKQLNRIIMEGQTILSSSISNDESILATGQKNGDISFVSLKSFKHIFTVSIGSKHVLSICFSKFDNNYLLACMENDYPVIFNFKTQKVEQSISTSSKAFYGLYSPHEKEVIVIGCFNEINIIRQNKIDVVTHNLCETLCMEWSPFEKNSLLITTSGGFVVCVDISSKTLFSVCNHSDKVRAITYHPTNPSIIASASYNGSIVISNIQNGTTLMRINSSVTHVYALSFSHDNPMLLLSAGRDSYIKFWSLDKITQKERIMSISQKDMKYIRPLDSYNDIITIISQFSSSDQSLHCINHENTPIKNMLMCFTEEKREKERINCNKNPEVLLQTNQIKNYCEFLWEKGEYDKAIAFSPSVSVSFWEELMRRNQMKPFASGGFDFPNIFKEDLSSFCSIVDKKGLSYALLAIDTLKQPLYKKENTNNTSKYSIDGNQNNDFLREYSVISHYIMQLLNSSYIYKAAIQYLRICDYESAIHILAQNGETIVAVTIDNILNIGINKYRERIVRYALDSHFRDSLMFLLDENYKQRVWVSLVFSDANKRQTFAKINNVNIQEALGPIPSFRSMLIVSKYQEAADSAIFEMIELLSQDNWDWNHLNDLIEECELIPFSLLTQSTKSKLIQLILYVHSYKAYWKQYLPQLNQISLTIKKLSQDEHISILDEGIRKIDMMIQSTKQPKISRINPLSSNIPHSIYRTTIVSNPESFSNTSEYYKWIDLTSINPGLDNKRLFI